MKRQTFTSQFVTNLLLIAVIAMLGWLILSEQLSRNQHAKEERGQLHAELAYDAALAEQLHSQREKIMSGNETYTARFLTENSAKQAGLQNLTIKMESANRLLDEMRVTLLTVEKGDMELYKQKQKMLGAPLVRWLDELRTELNSTSDSYK